MRSLKSLVQGAGTACLLVAIVLCQSVLAHNDARVGDERRVTGDRRFIHHYQLVRVQRVLRTRPALAVLPGPAIATARPLQPGAGFI